MTHETKPVEGVTAESLNTFLEKIKKDIDKSEPAPILYVSLATYDKIKSLKDEDKK